MKLILTFLVSLFCGLYAHSQEIWEVDNPHSNVRFEVGWQDFSMRTGEFKSFRGSITAASIENLTDAKISFIVDAASVDVIADRLADHIKSDKFLEVEQYPEITYTSDSVKLTSDNTYTSTGLLKICGVEKEQEATILVKGFKETNKGNIFGIQVSLEVDRSAFGLDWGSPRLSNIITIVGHLLYQPQVQEAEEK